MEANKKDRNLFNFLNVICYNLIIKLVQLSILYIQLLNIEH